MKKFFSIILLVNISNSLSTEKKYEFTLLTTKEIKPVINFMNETTLQALHEYPYLYVEKEKSESINHYDDLLKSKDSAVAIVYYDKNPIGFIAGLPFQYSTHYDIESPSLSSLGIDTKHTFYFSEAIINAEHRKQEIAIGLYTLLKKHAKTKGFTLGVCINESHKEHQLKPVCYTDLNVTFEMDGYQPITTLKSNWETLQPDGTTKDQEHVLQYWVTNFNSTKK